MRFYIFDDLVSPASGEPLRVEDAVIVHREGPPVSRCANWCGLRGAIPLSTPETDCQKCSSMWIERGGLTAGAARYPIVDGIPRFVSKAESTVDRDTQESFGYEWEHFYRV